VNGLGKRPISADSRGSQVPGKAADAKKTADETVLEKIYNALDKRLPKVTL
jgi:hypothetical protein